MALITRTPPPAQAQKHAPEVVQMKLQSKVLEIKLLDYKGKEHKIQVSISDPTFFEDWQPFTILETLNAEICHFINTCHEGKILGYQSCTWHEKGEGYIKGVEWQGKIIKNK